MRGRLFEDLVVSVPPAGLGRRAAVLPFSIAAHGAALALALLFPVLRKSELPPPAGPIETWHVPAAPTPPPPMATPAPPRIRSDGPVRASAPATVTEPVAPPPAPGPTVSTIEPIGLPTIEGPAPCFVNCDTAGPRDTGDGPPGPAASAPGGTGTGPIRVSTGGITPPVRTVYVAPIYPEIARPAGISATVVVECTIDPIGRVTDVRVLSGHPLFNEAAAAAVRQWRYTPTRLSGVPVAVLMTVTVRFIARR